VEGRRAQAPYDFSLLELTVPEWIENRIKEGTFAGLREIQEMVP